MPDLLFWKKNQIKSCFESKEVSTVQIKIAVTPVEVIHLGI